MRIETTKPALAGFFVGTYPSFAALGFVLFLLAALSSTAQVVNIESRRIDARKPGWQGYGEVWFSYLKNQNTATTLGTRLSLVYLKERHRFLLISDASFNQSNATNIESAGFQHVRYNYVLGPRWVWEGFGQVYFSRQMRLYPRYTFGSGPRYKVYKGDSMQVYLGASLMFEHEALQNPRQQYSSDRLSAYFSWVLSKHAYLKFDWMFLYQPRLAEFSDYRIQTELRCDVDLYKRIRLRLSGSILYDTHPPEGVPQTFIHSRTSVLVDF
jgi:putative salt-induced outer membrane protein YdiY